MQCTWQTVACLQIFSVPLLRGTSCSEMLPKTGFYNTRSCELCHIPGNCSTNPGISLPNAGNAYPTHLVGCMQFTRIPRNETHSWEFLSKSRECMHHTPPWLHAAHTCSQNLSLIPGNCCPNRGNTCPHVACWCHSFPAFILNPGNAGTRSRLWLHAGVTHSRDCYAIPGNFEQIRGNACTIPLTALSLVPGI